MNSYEPPRHVWGLIRDQIPESERLELKSMIGESLVDQTAELQREVELLLEIWTEVKERQLPSNRLPEPPTVRDLLTRDVRMFASDLRERLLEDKRDVSDLFRNDSVIDYILNENLSSSSNTRSTRSSHRPETPLTLDLQSLGMSCLKEQNDVQIEYVLKKIRNLMKDEIGQLEEDIGFIQESLENDSHVETVPSIADLRRTRARLERAGRELSTSEDGRRPNHLDSLRNFLLESSDLIPVDGPMSAREDEGFRSTDPLLFPSASSSSGFRTSSALLPVASFPFPSSSSPPPPPPHHHHCPSSLSVSTSSSSSPLFPHSRSGSGRRAPSPDAAEYVRVRCSRPSGRGHVVSSRDHRVSSRDDDDSDNTTVPTSSSSSSTSGIYSTPSSMSSSSTSSSSSSSSSSKSGRISSFQRRMDLLLSYRK